MGSLMRMTHSQVMHPLARPRAACHSSAHAQAPPAPNISRLSLSIFGSWVLLDTQLILHTQGGLGYGLIYIYMCASMPYIHSMEAHTQPLHAQ